MPLIDMSEIYQMTNVGNHIDGTDVYQSNRNLLDNPFFTVRQRGNGAFTSAVYTADRWKNTGANQSTTLTSQGLVIQQVNNGYDGVEQKLPADLSAALVGSALTLSINCLAVSGTYRYRMRFFNGDTLISAKFGGITSAGLYSVTMDEVPANTNLIVVDFFTNSGRAGDTITVAAIKLEKGSVSTLANDAPPKYKSELDDCEYYCRVLKGNIYNATGMAVASAQVRFTLPYQMYKQPTPSFSGTIRVLGTGGFLAVSAVTVSGWSESSVEIACTVSGATTYAPYFLAIGDNSQIVLSADL